MTEQERIAWCVRLFAEQADFAPEGLELYRWHWLPDSWHIFVGVKEPEIQLFAPMAEIPPHIDYQRFDVRRDHWIRLNRGTDAAVGWNVKNRTAVLFWMRGGMMPDIPRKRDGLIEKLAKQGQTLRTVDSLMKLYRLMQRLRDELDGEGWKHT